MHLTNLRPVPTMISKFQVEVYIGKDPQTHSEVYVPLKRLTNPGNTTGFYVGGGMSQAIRIDDQSFLDSQLVDRSLAPRVPVSGLALMTYPTARGFIIPARFKVTVIDVEGITFSSKPIDVTNDPSNNAMQQNLIKPIGIEDLKLCALVQN